MKAGSLAVIALALALLPTLCGTLRIASARSSDAMFRAYVGVDRRRTPLTAGALIVAALSFYYAFWWLLPAAPMRWR